MPPPVQPPMQGMVDPPHPMSSPGMPGSFGMKDFGKTDPFGPDPQGMGSVAMGSPGDAAVKAGKPAPSGGAPFATAPMLLGFGMPPFTMLVALASVPGVLAFAATAEFPSVSPTATFIFGGTVPGEVVAAACPSDVDAGAGAAPADAGGGLEAFCFCSSSSPCSRKAVAKRSRAHRRGSTKMACLLSSPRTCGSLFLSSSSSPSGIFPTGAPSLLSSCCFLWDASRASRLLFSSEVLFSSASIC